MQCLIDPTEFSDGLRQSSRQAEVEPFGIQTMVVNPGFFRTELLTEESTTYAKTSIEDYKERNAQQHEFWKAQNGKQSGDPAKLAQALITLTSQKELPRRFIAGADAIGTMRSHSTVAFCISITKLPPGEKSQA